MAGRIRRYQGPELPAFSQKNVTLKFRWPKLWPYCHLTNLFEKFGHVSVHYPKKGQSQWRFVKVNQFLTPELGGKNFNFTLC